MTCCGCQALLDVAAPSFTELRDILEHRAAPDAPDEDGDSDWSDEESESEDESEEGLQLCFARDELHLKLMRLLGTACFAPARLHPLAPNPCRSHARPGLPAWHVKRFCPLGLVRVQAERFLNVDMAALNAEGGYSFPATCVRFYSVRVVLESSQVDGQDQGRGVGREPAVMLCSALA